MGRGGSSGKTTSLADEDGRLDAYNPGVQPRGNRVTGCSGRPARPVALFQRLGASRQTCARCRQRGAWSSATMAKSRAVAATKRRTSSAPLA